jgi:acyl-coenzyme A thioesterase PaaI-like protein
MFNSLQSKTLKLRLFLNTYLPFLGAGIRVEHISDDFLAIDVRMPLYRGNKNYVGTHFGGSLYAMTDPFFMVMLMENLGKDYIIWDKAAHIDFISPGRGTVYAQFRLSSKEIGQVKLAAESGKAICPEYTVEVLGEDGKVVAKVIKTLYVKKKQRTATQ